MFIVRSTQNIVHSSYSTEYSILTTYHLSSSEYEITSSMAHGLNQISDIQKFNLPLDVIFKLIHANEIIPLIKFNPGKKQENIYKLYSSKMSINGRVLIVVAGGSDGHSCLDSVEILDLNYQIAFI